MPFKYEGSKNKHTPPKTKSIPPSTIGMRYAKKLQRVWREVNKNSGLHHRYPLVTTARSFDQLLKSINNDTTRLNKVLDWYIDHHHEEWSPKAVNGKGFYWKFPSIENAMARWERDHPQIKVRRKYIKLAVDQFGICHGAGWEESGHWTKEFIDLFPLALQMTRDNFCKFSNFIYSRKDYLTYHPLVPYCEEFTIEWFKELDDWFFQPKHRDVNPLHLVFDVRAKSAKTIKWIQHWCRDQAFVTGLADQFITGFLASKFNTNTFTPQELEVQVPYYDLMCTNN